MVLSFLLTVECSVQNTQLQYRVRLRQAVVGTLSETLKLHTIHQALVMRQAKLLSTAHGLTFSKTAESLLPENPPATLSATKMLHKTYQTLHLQSCVP